MKRLCLVVTLSASLACSGAGVFEAVTGVELPVEQVGPDAKIPAGFPLAAPPGATLARVVTGRVGDLDTVMVEWVLAPNTDRIGLLATYRPAFEAEGLEITERPGLLIGDGNQVTWSVSLGERDGEWLLLGTATRPAGEYRVEVGPDATIPGGYPLPSPPGATVHRVVVHDLDGLHTVAVDWTLAEGTDEDVLLAQYRGLFEGAGLALTEEDGMLVGTRETTEWDTVLTTAVATGERVLLTSVTTPAEGP